MNFDKWGEVINGEETFEQIAKDLIETGKCIIGWTDEGVDHRDILFTYKPKKYGNLQRGFRWCYLYFSYYKTISRNTILRKRMEKKNILQCND